LQNNFLKMQLSGRISCPPAAVAMIEMFEKDLGLT